MNHGAGEYVRGDIHTNTIEGVFSVFKRGMVGTYQHCGEQHLQRYLHEFDFRYYNRAKLGIDDACHSDLALKGIIGKRLTYRRTDKAYDGSPVSPWLHPLAQARGYEVTPFRRQFWGKQGLEINLAPATWPRLATGHDDNHACLLGMGCCNRDFHLSKCLVQNCGVFRY